MEGTSKLGRIPVKQGSGEGAVRQVMWLNTDIPSILIISECSCICEGKRVQYFFLQNNIPLAKGRFSMKFKLKLDHALISFSPN